MKKYIGARELAEKWGVTERRIRLMCQDGRIEGATKLGWSWSIPADTPKPYDGRHMRQYKKSFLRLGSIDIGTLNRLKDSSPIGDKLFSNARSDGYIASLIMLGRAMDGVSVSRDEVLSVFQLTPARSLTFSDSLRIAAFRSLFLTAVETRPLYSVRSVLAMHRAFCQGWDDRHGGSWRDGYIPGDESLSVDMQMETFFMQYDREWKGIHPVFKASILLAEMVRDRPFECDNCLFALLCSCAMLLGEGYLAPMLDESHMNELNATLALAGGKGNYEDLARLFERQIIESYSTVFQTTQNVRHSL